MAPTGCRGRRARPRRSEAGGDHAPLGAQPCRYYRSPSSVCWRSPSTPCCESHVLKGRPVLPVALMIDWLAHAALHQNPGLQFHGIDGLHVLAGVILDGPAPTVRVTAGKATKREGLFHVPVELSGTRAGRGTIHARAEVILAIDLPPAPSPSGSVALPGYSRAIEEAYNTLLFHGLDLQGIVRVDGCGETGITGSVRSAPPPAAWLHRPLRSAWLADPLALDAAFQLLILWSWHVHDAPCLPCVVGRIPPVSQGVSGSRWRDGTHHSAHPVARRRRSRVRRRGGPPGRATGRIRGGH